VFFPALIYIFTLFFFLSVRVMIFLFSAAYPFSPEKEGPSSRGDSKSTGLPTLPIPPHYLLSNSPFPPPETGGIEKGLLIQGTDAKPPPGERFFPSQVPSPSLQVHSSLAVPPFLITCRFMALIDTPVRRFSSSLYRYTSITVRRALGKN